MNKKTILFVLGMAGLGALVGYGVGQLEIAARDEVVRFEFRVPAPKLAEIQPTTPFRK